jgi:hypothetical protein
VRCCDGLAAVLLGEFESKISNALRSCARDNLEVFNDTRYDFVLDASVLALGVLSDGHNVHVVVLGLVAGD